WNRSPFCVALLALDDACRDGQLVDCTSQRRTGDVLADAGEREEHATRLAVGDPPLGRALTGTHAGLSRLLGERTVRVDVDPHLAATLDVTRHGDTSGLDLTVGHVSGCQRLDAV